MTQLIWWVQNIYKTIQTTRQNTKKSKYIVTIKKNKTPIKMELTTLLDISLNSSLPFARDSYLYQ
jgi:hypothetical protein